MFVFYRQFHALLPAAAGSHGSGFERCVCESALAAITETAKHPTNLTRLELPQTGEWRALLHIELFSWSVTLFLQYIHRLLCALYERDCRRPFCSLGHWEALHMQQIPPELFMESSEGRGTLQ